MLQYCVEVFHVTLYRLSMHAVHHSDGLSNTVETTFEMYYEPNMLKKHLLA